MMTQWAIDSGPAPTVFVLAPTGATDLGPVVVGGGWCAVGAASSEDVAQDFLASEAAVAMIDARGTAANQGLVAARALGGIVAANGAALLILTDGQHPALVDDLFTAGATHLLANPRDDRAIVDALRFAERHAVRTNLVVERRGAPLAGQHDANTAAARRWIGGAIAAGGPVAVLLLALSRLDFVNAAHGRPTVDALIEAAGERIVTAATAAFGATMIAVRISGSTFAIAARCDAAGAAAAAAAIGEALARPFSIHGTHAVLGVRIGIAGRNDDDDAATLLRRASEALAGAKASDGTVRIAGDDDGAPLDVLAVDLHQALERGEIDLRFQPQVQIATGRITGVEALARWDHARLGPLGAESLFAAADRADLGIALSDHIQQLVLARAACWPRQLAALRLSLNLTAADVTRPGFAALFLARVDASGFPRGRLTVEITETGLIEDLPAAARFFAELRGAGCRVAIDDFGTGYSSLAYLKSLPLDYLKIDKALAKDIDGSPRDRVVVRGVIDMARSLGLAVIAEGVETEAQLALLKADGCAYYQGFLRAGPLEEAALIAMMEDET